MSLDQHNEQLKSHKEHLERIQARLEVHDDHFAGMFEVMHKQFTRIDERFDKMDERFDRLDDRFLRQELLMEQWRSDCRVFLEGFHSNRERIDDLENRVGRLEFRR